MNPRTKIRVKREDLLAAVKAQRDAALAQYEKDLEKYEAGLARTAERQAAFLTKTLEGLKDKPITDTYEFRNKFPTPPSKPSKPTHFDRVLSQLEMSVDETLSLSVEDYSAYISGGRR